MQEATKNVDLILGAVHAHRPYAAIPEAGKKVDHTYDTIYTLHTRLYAELTTQLEDFKATTDANLWYYNVSGFIANIATEYADMFENTEDPCVNKTMNGLVCACVWRS